MSTQNSQPGAPTNPVNAEVTPPPSSSLSSSSSSHSGSSQTSTTSITSTLSPVTQLDPIEAKQAQAPDITDVVYAIQVLKGSAGYLTGEKKAADFDKLIQAVETDNPTFFYGHVVRKAIAIRFLQEFQKTVKKPKFFFTETAKFGQAFHTANIQVALYIQGISGYPTYGGTEE